MSTKDILFGMRPVMEAIASGQPLDKVLLQRGLRGPQVQELTALLAARDIPRQEVPVQKLNGITRKNHQGVVAFTSPVHFQRIEQLLPGIWEKGRSPLLLMLDRITDVRNFGGIVRSAACAGADAVIIPARGAAQVGSDAAKTSAGALFHMPICREASLEATVKFLQESGLQVIACTEKAGQTLYTCDLSLPTALLMGSEEDGISPPLLKAADALAKLPMKGAVASLNVGVAAGIALYEAVRQRLIVMSVRA